jgi:plastocyanin
MDSPHPSHGLSTVLISLAALGCSGNSTRPPPDTAGDPVINGCRTYVDRSQPNDDRTVAFFNYAYQPNCIFISAGQSVRFTGDFSMHPFRPGVAMSRASMDPAGTMPNPMTATDTGASAMFTFPSAGIFPYNCIDHEGTGMYGVVLVR